MDFYKSEVTREPVRDREPEPFESALERIVMLRREADEIEKKLIADLDAMHRTLEERAMKLKALQSNRV